MGYTHYWYQNTIPEKSFNKLRSAIADLLGITEVPIVGAFGDLGTVPEITGELISFNGLEDDSHETFYLKRVPHENDRSSRDGYSGFSFCKTARKPYDVVVVAALCLAHHFCGEYMAVSSDGDPEEWADGHDLAKTIVPDVVIPPTLKEY